MYGDNPQEKAVFVSYEDFPALVEKEQASGFRVKMIVPSLTRTYMNTQNHCETTTLEFLVVFHMPPESISVY